MASSIGKKVGMAVTGMMVYGFLLGHLAGNFLLFRDDGGEQFNAYSKFLTEHPLLVPVELVLLVAFLLHIHFGISVARANRRARPQAYKKTRALGRRSWASRSMVFSGLIILVFVVTHLRTFKYADHSTGTLYQLVMETFSQPIYASGYALAMLVLGFHLWHALQRAFQTLGLGTGRRIWAASTVLAVIIAGGFGAIPLWAFLRG